MIGHAHDQRFIFSHLAKYPHEFKRHIISNYKETFEKQGRRNANLSLLKTSEQLSGAKIKLAADDEAIREKAKHAARQCSKAIARAGIFAGIAYAKDVGIKIPETETDAGLIARLSDEQFWRRSLRKKHGRTVEKVAIGLGIVNKYKDIYASDASCNRRKGQKTRNRQILESCLAVNELGQEYTLQELADLSVSNPVIRRGELMTRIAGFEDYARNNGFVGVFFTFTCPSRFHAVLSKTGKRNPKYDGSTPRDAQQYLSKVWARIRAKLKRENLAIFGFRVCEPQQDGTPHWHLLLFVSESNSVRLGTVCRDYCLRDSPEEQGAKKYRFDSKRIDWKKGTAAGYIAKYIAKNIDGFGIDQDLFGNDPIKAAQRVDAWASTWGIRQFQQIGGPRVGVWRELRRVKDEALPDGLMEAHAAADAGNWRKYCEVMQQQSISVAKVWNDKPGRYMEPLGEQIIGVKFAGEIFQTRNHIWEIKSNGRSNTELHRNSNNADHGCGAASRSGNAHDGRGICEIFDGNSEGAIYQGSASARTDSKIRGAIAPPWSPVNNCTEKTKSEYETAINSGADETCRTGKSRDVRKTGKGTRCSRGSGAADGANDRSDCFNR